MNFQFYGIVLEIKIRLREETKKSVRVFESICCAAAAWNKIFSIPLLLLITTRLITVSFGLFALIQGLFIPVDWIEGVDELFYLFFINDFVMLVIVFTAADMPSKEVHQELLLTLQWIQMYHIYQINY